MKKLLDKLNTVALFIVGTVGSLMFICCMLGFTAVTPSWFWGAVFVTILSMIFVGFYPSFRDRIRDE